ncbi:cytochrome c biogenesis protein, transmembrane region [Rhodopirellula sallentina SM41]|uniref:Cytochrome c biogenesis protein, transmembrane region n=1 Tax=Rhodopirellula sallentina SM41 TaxID=1263870 RepID=M5ULC1_9BACT|nr:cytochrome c biogenesis protein, transmembrane region [Rhodopirellula sallentina SM41]
MAAFSALWLGVLTSISPCPLATNIAAISYIGGRVEDTRRVLLAGVLYTLGRVIAYLGLAWVLVNTMLSVPQVSVFLQKYMHMLLGPLLILVGMFLLGFIEINLAGKGVSDNMTKTSRFARHLGIVATRDSLRTRVLSDIGGVVFRQCHGLTRCRFHDHDAAALRSRHGTAGDCVCDADRVRIETTRQRIQCRWQNRVVGSQRNRRPDVGHRNLYVRPLHLLGVIPNAMPHQMPCPTTWHTRS